MYVCLTSNFIFNFICRSPTSSMDPHHCSGSYFIFNDRTKRHGIVGWTISAVRFTFGSIQELDGSQWPIRLASFSSMCILYGKGGYLLKVKYLENKLFFDRTCVEAVVFVFPIGLLCR